MEEILKRMKGNAVEGESSSAGSERAEQEAFDYDVILDHIGQLGKFQLMTCLWLLVPAMFSALVIMSYSFTGAKPQFRYGMVS